MDWIPEDIKKWLLVSLDMFIVLGYVKKNSFLLEMQTEVFIVENDNIFGICFKIFQKNKVK